MPNNAFDILGVPRHFAQDAAALRSRYLQASAATHPDRFTDPLEQADAAERAAQINDAYQTLTDPERRANALLALLGGPAKEADSSLPPDLLMEIMEVREGLEEATAKNDQPAIENYKQWATEQRRAHLQTIADLFQQALAQDSDANTPNGTFKKIRLELNVLRYVERMIAQMPS